MSISTTTSSAPKNPIDLTLEYKGDTGKFYYYDKEKKENIFVDLPLEFVVIDELSAITGFDDVSGSSIYSNEVHSTVKEDLIVKSFKGGDIARGKYQDIKADIMSAGGKYCKCIYAKVKGIDRPLRIRLKGISLSAWIDFQSENKGKVIGVTVKEVKDGKKGKVEFKIPVFEVNEDIVSSKEYDAAFKFDQEELVPYRQTIKEIYGDNEKVAEETKQLTEDVQDVFKENTEKAADLPF